MHGETDLHCNCCLVYVYLYLNQVCTQSRVYTELGHLLSERDIYQEQNTKLDTLLSWIVEHGSRRQASTRRRWLDPQGTWKIGRTSAKSGPTSRISTFSPLCNLFRCVSLLRPQQKYNSISLSCFYFCENSQKCVLFTPFNSYKSCVINNAVENCLIQHASGSECYGRHLVN